MPVFQLQLSSQGNSFGNSARITAYGQLIQMPGNGYGRGLNVAILNPVNARTVATGVYDTSVDAQASDSFADLIERTPIGSYVFAAVRGDAAGALSERARRACRMIGSGLIGNLAAGGSWVIAGQKGAAPGAVVEQLSNFRAAAIDTMVQVATVNMYGLQIAATSGGFNGGNRAEITIQGTTVAIDGGYRRGLNVAVLDGTSAAVLATYNFDTYVTGPADTFAALIEGLPSNRIVAIAVLDDAASGLTERAKVACESLGSARIRNLAWRGSWAMIGFTGAMPGTVAEAAAGNSPVTSTYWHLPETGSDDQGFSFAVLSAGFSFGSNAAITIAGFSFGALAPGAAIGRGLNVAIVSQRTGEALDALSYDTYASAAAADAFAAMIEQLPLGQLVAVAVADDAANSLTERAKRACEMIGSGLIRNLSFRGSWAILGRKGCAPGSVPEALRNDGAVSLEGWFDTEHGRDARTFMEIQADSAGYNVGNTASVAASPNVSRLALSTGRGLNVMVFDETSGQAIFSQAYDTCGNPNSGFAAMVAALPAKRVVAIAVRDEATANLTEQDKLACESLGSGQIRNLAYRGSWAFVGKKGAASTAVAEALCNDSSASARYWLFPDSIYPGQGFNISASSAGTNVGNTARITLNGTAVAGLPGPGLNFAVIDQDTGSLLQLGYATPSQGASQADAFAMAIEAFPSGRVVAVAIMGDAAVNLTERAKRACETLGSAFIRSVQTGDSWTLVGIKGTAPGSALERLGGNASAAVSTWIPFARPRTTQFLWFVLPIVAWAVGMVYYMSQAIPNAPSRPVLQPAAAPRPRLRFNQVTFLAAHNAMANMTDGWSRINSQQYGSVTKQLAQGVRAFALDVFAFVAAPGAAQDLFLCHGECGGSFSGPMPPRRLADTLGEIVTFLNANPNEFVTILFETGDTINPDASRNTLFEAAFTSSGATDLIFWPDSTNANPPANARTWNVNPNCGNTYTWPLIDDLKQANKRLAMFVDKDLGTNGALPRHIVPFVWRYMRENTYSDQDFFNIWSAEATERGESQSKAGRLAQQTGRSALILNHFPAVPHLHTWINYFFMNSYDRLLARTKSNVALFGIVPNFIQIDFIEVGGAARLVKTINEKVWTSSDPVAALNALEPDAIDRGL